MISDKQSEALSHILQSAAYELTAGIHAKEGGEGHDGLTNAALGEIHEFGLGVPMRSFIRAWFDENESRINEMTDAALDRVLQGADMQTEANRLALWMEGDIKSRILSRLQPELSDATKAKRGEGAVPLVASSQLIGSIRGQAERA